MVHSKLNSSIAHVRNQPLNTYHVLVGSAGLVHVIPDSINCEGTSVHHILSKYNLTQSSHPLPFHIYHDSLHVNFAYKLLHAEIVSHVDSRFQEKSDEVYHPSNVACANCAEVNVGVQSDNIVQLWIDMKTFVHPFKWISSLDTNSDHIFLKQRIDLALARQSL